MSCSAYSSIFSHDKNGNEHINVRRVLTSMWMPGAGTITVCGVSAFKVGTQAILQIESSFLRDCLRGGRVPKLAGLPAPCMGKGSFPEHFSFQNTKAFYAG